MKNSWTQTFRRLAAGAIVAGATTFSSAMCYAINAFDSAADPVYTPAWNGIVNSDASPYGQISAGDNGGTGFNAWNFNSSYYYWFPVPPVWYNYDQRIHAVDNGLKTGVAYSNINNDIGKAWDLGIVHYANRPNGDPIFTLPRAGRGFQTLQPGQTFSTIIDNPGDTSKAGAGLIVRLNSAPFVDANGMGLDGNICYHKSNCTPGVTPEPKERFGIYTSNTGAATEWRLSDGTSTNILTGLLTSTTAAGGMKIDFTLTGPDAYAVTLTPLGGGLPYVHAGTLANAGLPITWIQYENFNSVPSGVNTPTDLYVSQMSIVPEPATFGLIVIGAGVVGLGTVRRRRR
jgi:PEP-CTERM motif-containing protein